MFPLAVNWPETLLPVQPVLTGKAANCETAVSVMRNVRTKSGKGGGIFHGCRIWMTEKTFHLNIWSDIVTDYSLDGSTFIFMYLTNEMLCGRFLVFTTNKRSFKNELTLK